jgi:hypothetical protein
MTEVSDLPDPVAGCRRLPGIRMLRRNDLVWASGNSRSALDQRTLRLELVQSYRNAKRQEKWEATPKLDLERRVIGKVMRRLNQALGFSEAALLLWR